MIKFSWLGGLESKSKRALLREKRKKKKKKGKGCYVWTDQDLEQSLLGFISAAPSYV